MSRHVKRMGKGKSLAEEVGQVLNRGGEAVPAELFVYDVDGYTEQQYQQSRKTRKQQRKKRARGEEDDGGEATAEVEARSASDAGSNAPEKVGDESPQGSDDAVEQPSGSPTGRGSRKKRSQRQSRRHADAGRHAEASAPAADEGEGSDELEDIEALVREATSRSAQPEVDAAEAWTPIDERLDRLFRLKADNLDADLELKRIFGNVADPENDGAGRGNGGRPQQRKSLLITPDPRWPPVSCPGFEVKQDADNPGVHYVVESGEALKVSKAVKASMLSDDPNRVAELVHKNFWHPRACYQYAVMCSVMDRRDEAALLFKRASHAIASEMRGSFSLLDSHINRALPYVDEGSDVIYLNFQQLMHMHIRSGCLRTAFELCKLIFNMDPRDPCGMLYNLEFLALRGGHTQWLLDVCSAWRDYGSTYALLPVCTFGAALAYLRQGDAATALKYAKKGATDWPELIAHLVPASDEPGAVFAKEPELGSAAWHVVQCYAARMKATWGEPKALALLRKALDHAAGLPEVLLGRVAERDALLRDFHRGVRANAVIGVVDEVMAGRDPERAAMRRMWEARFTHLPGAVQHRILDKLADADFSLLNVFSPVRLFLQTFLPWHTLPAMLAGRVMTQWRHENPTDAAEYDLDREVQLRLARRGPG
eukprot:TRINITY_DN27521_c0_g1_i1.p1 TRINITY_DN27521_c0_g1~~TRINITY_DN27521_c0_g1_i1.p1  ORF type:complete len:653 (+),score=163.13 TRINITY_DN27521_c0_g1_i1:147-2105(+)